LRQQVDRVQHQRLGDTQLLLHLRLPGRRIAGCGARGGAVRDA
jgi:hypothetical protein